MSNGCGWQRKRKATSGRGARHSSFRRARFQRFFLFLFLAGAGDKRQRREMTEQLIDLLPGR
jgi:hypothetical protein